MVAQDASTVRSPPVGAAVCGPDDHALLPLAAHRDRAARSPARHRRPPDAARTRQSPARDLYLQLYRPILPARAFAKSALVPMSRSRRAMRSHQDLRAPGLGVESLRAWRSMRPRMPISWRSMRHIFQPAHHLDGFRRGTLLRKSCMSSHSSAPHLDRRLIERAHRLGSAAEVAKLLRTSSCRIARGQGLRGCSAAAPPPSGRRPDRRRCTG